MSDVKFQKISRREIEARKELLAQSEIDQDFLVVDKNINRQDIINLEDKTFFNTVMNVFENNQISNSCYINEFKDESDSDFSLSFNVKLDYLNTCIYLEDGKTYGEYQSRIISSSIQSSVLNDFYLIMDGKILSSSTIKFYLITNSNEVYPIIPNNKNPLIIEQSDKTHLPESVKIKIEINEGVSDFKSVINGLALLYNDTLLNDQLDIYKPMFDTNVNLPPEEDIVTLYRDPKKEDSLVKVESYNERVLLYYNENQELTSLDIINPFTNKLLSTVEMVYEDYTNSDNNTEKVLTKIRTKNSILLEER